MCSESSESLEGAEERVTLPEGFSVEGRLCVWTFCFDDAADLVDDAVQSAAGSPPVEFSVSLKCLSMKATDTPKEAAMDWMDIDL